MNIKNLKQAYKIYDNSLKKMQNIRVLLSFIYEKNICYYPINYMFTIIQRDEKNVTNNIIQITNILSAIIENKLNNK